jgi:hypothetical protein
MNYFSKISLKKPAINPEPVYEKEIHALGIVGLFYGVSQILWWVATAYFQASKTVSISFPGNDGHCESSTQGIGIHCFGDYYHPVGAATSNIPYDSKFDGIPYPAITLKIMQFFHDVNQYLFGSRGGLVFYLILMIIGLCTPLIFFPKFVVKRNLLLFLVTLGPLSYPAIIALDRGSTTGFVVPFLTLLFFSLAKQREDILELSIILLTLVRPQFALLLILLIIGGSWTRAIIASFKIFLLYLFGFSLLSRSVVTNVHDWLINLTSFNDYQKPGKLYPTNVSFDQINYLFTKDIWSDLDLAQNSGLIIQPLIHVAEGKLGLIILILVIFHVSIFGYKGNRTECAFMLVLSVFLAPSVAFAYNMVVALPILAFMVSGYTKELNIKVRNRTFSFKRISIYLIGSAVVLIPLPRRVDNEIILTSARAFPVFALVFLMVVGAVIFQNRRSSHFGQFEAIGTTSK